MHFLQNDMLQLLSDWLGDSSGETYTIGTTKPEIVDASV